MGKPLRATATRLTREYRQRKRAKGICIEGGCEAPTDNASWRCSLHTARANQIRVLSRQTKAKTRSKQVLNSG